MEAIRQKNATVDRVVKEILESEPNFSIEEEEGVVVDRTISTTFIDSRDQMKVLVWALKEDPITF